MRNAPFSNRFADKTLSKCSDRLFTHENPENLALIQLAVAKGACVFEKHVGVPTSNYPLNAYSCSPNQYFKWLEAFSYAMKVCGEVHNAYL